MWNYENTAMPKPNNSVKSRNRCKTQIPNKMVLEEVLKSLRVEMIPLKSFVAAQIYIIKKKSKYYKTPAHWDDSQILVKSLNDQIGFLQSEINLWFLMVIKTKWGNQINSA